MPDSCCGHGSHPHGATAAPPSTNRALRCCTADHNTFGMPLHILTDHASAGVSNSVLDPQQDFSCLAVVLDMALTPTQPQQQPLLYEQCLELLYRLSEQLQSREAMLSLLRKPPYSLLMSQIGVVLQVDETQHQEVKSL